jgi:Fe-S-cluster containining protein
VKISLPVVQGTRTAGGAAHPVPGEVRLSEPMLRFRCNQKGCCCSGWDIPFRVEDFVRLHEHLAPDERATLTRGIQLVLEQGEDADVKTLHSLKLDGVGEDRACRYLAPGGTCSVHARYGLDALPDLCVDFPAFAYRQGDRVDLWYDPVCPEVIERLDESDAPLRIHAQHGAFGDPALDLRVAHVAEQMGGRIGDRAVDPLALDRIRESSAGAFALPGRPVWKTLLALAHAYRRLRTGNEGAFEVVEPEDPQPFLRFLADSIGAHGADLLIASARRYRPFIHAIDPTELLASPRLADALTDWPAVLERRVSPAEETLQPLASRWLAHRFATVVVKGHGELRESCDGIVHLYATSLRYAGAFAEALDAPLDRRLYKVAIGAAEFFYRSLNLPREVLPWFAAA